MQFMILRKSDARTEAGAASGLERFRTLLAQAGVPHVADELHASAGSLRLTMADGAVGRTDGPFANVKELVAGFVIIEVPSKQAAVEWAQRWPLADDENELELEIRQMGCPGGCAEVEASGPDSPGKRFIILLRSDKNLEADVIPAQSLMDALGARNARDAQAGILLAGDGLRGSAGGARVKFSSGRTMVVDGPFTEVKEMIAGYWMIRVAALQDAIEWAQGYPYPSGPTVEVEIREIREAHQAHQPAAFTPELREAEQRMRAQQLESGLQADLAPASLAWR